jgi:hypothetical protein
MITVRSSASNLIASSSSRVVAATGWSNHLCQGGGAGGYRSLARKRGPSITLNANLKCSALAVPFRRCISSTTRLRQRMWQAWAALSFIRLFTSWALKICSQSARAICTPSRIASGFSPSRARTSARKDSIRASVMGHHRSPDPKYILATPVS